MYLFGPLDQIRTDTGRNLKPLPLPIGLRGEIEMATEVGVEPT